MHVELQTNSVLSQIVLFSKQPSERRTHPHFSVPKHLNFATMKSLWLLLAVTAVVAQDTDQFTYQDQGSFSPNRIFPPSQWISVNCQDTNTCPGWPERFGARQGWDFVENSCVHCPASGSTSESCQVHHQSPINLQRDRAINGSAFYKDCIDVHWMHVSGDVSHLLSAISTGYLL